MFLYLLSIVNAKEFRRPTGLDAQISKINIVELDGMLVNENCLKQKKDCLMFFIKNEKKQKKIVQKDHVQAGNPASIYCSSVHGASEIYTDIGNNQYDFCNFDEKYIIDSWSLLKRFKK